MILSDTHYPLISVLIPLFNKSKVVEFCLHSVLAQTYQNFEIVVVDDASSDNSVDVVNSFNDTRIRLIRHQLNKGPAAARNTGCSNALGEIFSFLDGDDIWHPKHLEWVVEKFQEYPTRGIVYSHYYRGPKWTVEGEDIYKKVLDQGYLCMPSVLSVSKKIIEKVHPFDETYTYSEDDDMCFELSRITGCAIIPYESVIMLGTANSLTLNKKGIAHGYLKLYREYKVDILELCGPSALAKHLLKTTVAFIDAKEYRLFFSTYVETLCILIKSRSWNKLDLKQLIFRPAAKLILSMFVNSQRKIIK